MTTKKIKALNLRGVSRRIRRPAEKWGFTPLNAKNSGSYSRNLTGFTLTELLVVIVIVGIVVSSVTIALNTSRMSSRDTRRVNEIKTLQEALELYKNTERSYPSVITAGSPLVGPISGLTFLQKVPSDPAPSDGNCSGLGYVYTPSSTTGYVISYCLGQGTAQIAAGNHYARPTGIDVAQCTPACGGKECGDDSCGGSCGTCVAPQTCSNGVCSCTPDCAGKTCGDDGCGGSCGSCVGVDPTSSGCSSGTCATDTYTKLMLHMNDATLTDHSASNHTTTLVGSVARSSTQSKFGGYSANFTGGTDYISMADSADWNFGSGAFTIDAWIYPTATNTTQVIATQGSTDDVMSWRFWLDTGALLKYTSCAAGSVCNTATSSAAITANTWQHVAVVRNGNSLRLYVGGIDVGGNDSWTYTPQPSDSLLYIGSK